MTYSFRYIRPKLTGTIVKEKVKCGKPNCRCNKGKPHKYYFYHYFRRLLKGVWRLNKQYIAKNKVKYLRKKIKLAKEKENKIKKSLKMNMVILKNTNLFLRKTISIKEYMGILNEIT